VRDERAGCQCPQTNPARAEFDHDQLYDALQRAGGELSDYVCGSEHSGFQLDHRYRQYRFQPVVFEQLFEPAALLSDDVRAHIALGVGRR
jgi:hypothetical protein